MNALVDAGQSIGLPRVVDVNEVDGPRIGHTMANSHKGRRVSAAHAFLHPIRITYSSYRRSSPESGAWRSRPENWCSKKRPTQWS